MLGRFSKKKKDRCFALFQNACLHANLSKPRSSFSPQMLIKAGVDGKPTVFLFSDNQIKEESFVEDINMILNTGDVPNIFPADEKADVIDKMQTVARVEVGLLISFRTLSTHTSETWQDCQFQHAFSCVRDSNRFTNA